MAKIHETLRSQPGNALPLTGVSSGDVQLVDYHVGFRRPVVAIDSTGYFVRPEETGTQFTYGGQTGGITITMPAPQAGLWYEFAATGAIDSSGTKFTCPTSDAFIVVGSSAGVTTVQAGATSVEFTLGGLYAEFVGLSSARYLLRSWLGGASAATSGLLDGAS